MGLCFDSPNFFILDEPTNHLDMETIEALGEALNKFKVSFAVSMAMVMVTEFVVSDAGLHDDDGDDQF